MWHWLVTHGLYDDLLSWSVFFVMGTLVVGACRKGYKRFVHNQTVIADRLSTDTPGGLHDVVEAINTQTEQLSAGPTPGPS